MAKFSNRDRYVAISFDGYMGEGLNADEAEADLRRSSKCKLIRVFLVPARIVDGFGWDGSSVTIFGEGEAEKVRERGDWSQV